MCGTPRETLNSQLDDSSSTHLFFVFCFFLFLARFFTPCWSTSFSDRCPLIFLTVSEFQFFRFLSSLSEKLQYPVCNCHVSDASIINILTRRNALYTIKYSTSILRHRPPFSHSITSISITAPNEGWPRSMSVFCFSTGWTNCDILLFYQTCIFLTI